MDKIIQLLSDYTFQTVALGSGLLGITSGVLGSFAVLRKQSLLGDGVSHSALPGVVLAFLALGSKNTEVLLLGALLSGLLSTLLILAVVEYTTIGFDSALALVMSTFFGLGMVLLTYVQKLPNANQAGLSRFIFGQASTLLQRDLRIIGISAVVLITLVLVFWKEFKLFSFDPDFARCSGFSVKFLNLLLSLMIVAAIIIGLQTVGVILMSAMLIAPAVAARQWTHKLGLMVALSAFFGALSGILGTTASSLIPKMPTGPAIVVCVSTMACISMLLSPKRGILSTYLQRRKNKAQFRRRPHESTS